MNKQLLLLMITISFTRVLFANSFEREHFELNFKNGQMHNLEYSEISNYPDSMRLGAFNLAHTKPGVELSLNFEHHDEFLNTPYKMIKGDFNVSSARARTGVFSSAFAGENSIILQPTAGSLFGGAQHNPSFTVAFWVNPLRLGDGEVIFSYESPVEYGGQYFYQSIKAFVEIDKIVWRFENIFFDGVDVPLVFELAGESILRGHWSHQMISFDAQRGFLQLLNDNQLVATRYTNKQNSALHPTMMAHFQQNDEQQVELGRFLGYLDSIVIAHEFFENVDLARYEKFGYYLSEPVMIAGRVVDQLIVNSQVADYAQIRIFVRSGLGAQVLLNMPDDQGWRLVDENLLRALSSSNARFLQIRLDFYAGKNQNTSPIVQDLKIAYYQTPIPPRPGVLSYTKEATGALVLEWQPVMVSTVVGYRLYFGTQSGEYFGYLDQGSSPIDVENNLNIALQGLKEGQMYYIALVSYDDLGRESEFSPELVVLY